MFLKKKRNYHEAIHNGAIDIKWTTSESAIGIEKPVYRPSLRKTSQESRKWLQLILFAHSHRVLISSPRLLKKSVRLIPAENKRRQLCLQIELAEEKSQSLHSQKSPRWTQQMYVTKEKNRYSGCYKKVFTQSRNWPETLLKPEPDPKPDRKARLRTLQQTNAFGD